MTDMTHAVTVDDEVGTALDPIERREAAAQDTRNRATATRRGSLDGQVLAVIDNGTGARLTPRLVERLKQEYAFEDVIVVLKDTVNVPPRPEDWAIIKARATAGIALYGA